ncbi:MAG: PQQ-binding-like beta-propeller repeat protein [Dehalococcoidales bacterium]|nr:PQQ-binding-like beta-propeller repeat protein [Dehalococcoidales bacterium]
MIVKSVFKTPFLLLILLIGLVLTGCRPPGLGAVPKGWSGGVIDDGVLFIGSMTGSLVAVNATDGSLLSAVPLDTSGVAVYGSLDVDEGSVYVPGYDGKVRAFVFEGARLGEEPRWDSQAENTNGSIVGGLVIDGDKVYYATSGGQVYAVDIANGNRQWMFETGDKIWSTPVVSGETLYIGSFDNKLYALSAESGSLKWQFETEGAIVSTPVIYENTLYFGSFDRHFYAVDSASGNLVWKSESRADNWFWATPLIYEGTVYAPNLDGKVYAFDTISGKELSEFELGSPVASSPVLMGNSIIVAAENGTVFALDTINGQEKQLINLAENVRASLAADGETVYIHTSADKVYALNARSGAQLWSLSMKEEAPPPPAAKTNWGFIVLIAVVSLILVMAISALGRRRKA